MIGAGCGCGCGWAAGLVAAGFAGGRLCRRGLAFAGSGCEPGWPARFPDLSGWIALDMGKPPNVARLRAAEESQSLKPPARAWSLKIDMWR